MILILGSEKEFHSKYVFEFLKQQNEEVEYLNTGKFPVSDKINWFPTDSVNSGNFVIDGKKISFNEIKSIYWRWQYSVDICKLLNIKASSYTSFVMNKEIAATTDSLFYALKCNWVNPIEAIYLHRTKAYQLFLLAQNGFRVPKTLISNDSEEIIKFAEENNYDLIYKPVQGGCHTAILTKDDLSADRLNSFKTGAVQFQEKLDGTDIRVYIVGDKIFPAEIRAKTIDFRSDKDAEIVPVKLPPEIEKQCFKIADMFKLKFTGIDIKTKSNGEYVFIEANPSPMFVGFERQSKYNITETLCELLKKEYR
ncbi:MAG: hypothetical protein K6C94_09200 [Candidatus Gastranaerophilales bacterium]|nr:hypothetical protein [Candidatus Gastranaerophilales bacterium]